MGARKQHGFTLLEVILGLAISSALLVSALLFFFHVQRIYIKSQVVAEVEGQGIQAMQIILQTIRDADEIESPTAGNTSNTLSLDVPNVALDSTIFAISDGVLQVTENTGYPVDLTNDRVIVSNLSFTNLSTSGDFSSLRVEFDLSYASPNDRNEFSYSKTFQSATSFFSG